MSLFSYIKQQLPILDVIIQTVPLKQAGHYWKASCPFHAETDASFTVSPDKQIFYCFGCHASGDVISFMAKKENMTPIEAAHHLVEQFEIDVPDDLLQVKKLSSEEKKEKNRYFQLCETVSAWCHEELLKNKPARDYTLSRSINETTTKAFHIGYLPGGTRNIDRFIRDMQQKNFLAQDLIDHGFLMGGRTMFSPFEERILFPITNNLGKYCGFGGRVFKKGDERPKYYNSKESEGFEKGKILYGFNQAKKSMREKNHAFLVEGYMDCVIMVQYGYLNTIATLGTACTLDHLKKASRYVNTLFVLFDGDKSGHKAMLRLAEMAWEVTLDLKVISLPEGSDPASYLIENGSLDSLTSSALDIIAFYIHSTGHQFFTKSLAEKLTIAQKIVDVIANLSDPFKQDLLLQQAAFVTQLPFDSLKKLMKRRSFKDPQGHVQPELKPLLSPNHQKNDIIRLEENLISVILNDMKSSNVKQVPDTIKPYFSENAQRLLDHINQLNPDGMSEKHTVLESLETLDPSLKAWAVRICMAHENTINEHDFSYLIDRFCKYHWRQIVKDIKAKIAHAQEKSDNEKLQHELKQLAELKKRLLSRGLI